MLAKQVFYCLSHTSIPFYSGYFGGGILKTIPLGWPRTIIFLISVPQIARITGVILALSMLYYVKLSPSLLYKRYLTVGSFFFFVFFLFIYLLAYHSCTGGIL
jgi:hypothetical protein